MAYALRRPSASPASRPTTKVMLGPDWPFTWLFLGFPLWWALGLGATIYPLFAVVMAVQLLQRRRVRLPRVSRPTR